MSSSQPSPISAAPIPPAASEVARPLQNPTLGLVAVIASVFISTLTFAMMTPLLALRLAAEGVDGVGIGANAGAGAAAILLVTLFTPWLGRKLGGFRALMLSILVMALGVGLLPIFHSLTGWFVLRCLIGAGIAVHWVISEVWINIAAGESNRGKIVGLYVAAMGLAYCVAYPLLLVIGTEGVLPFVLVTATIAAAGIPIILARRLVPDLPSGKSAGAFGAIKRQPAVMGASLLAGFAISVVLSFFAVYAQRAGMTERMALAMLCAVALGNVLLQIPIGMMADRASAEKLLIAVSAVGLAGLALMSFLPVMSLLKWPFLFVWGGSLGGFYTLSLTLVGRRFRRDELAGANAAFVIVYEFGCLLGPLASGLALDLWTPHGVLVPLAAAYIVFILGRLIARNRRPAPVAPI